MVAVSIGVPKAYAQQEPLAACPLQPNVSTVPLDLAVCQKKVDVWVPVYAKWFERYEIMQGERKVSNFGTRPTRLGKRPPPPVFLPEDCQNLVSTDSSSFKLACDLVADWVAPIGVEQNRQKIASALHKQEQPSHSAWLSHVHIDGSMSLQSNFHAYGFGTHVTTTVADHLEIFLTPGFLMLYGPSLSSSNTWQPTYDYGFGYKGPDFIFLGKPATIHFSFVKLLGVMFQSASLTGGSGNPVMGVLSITFR